MTFVMGLDQRAQITAEWLHRLTGELSRARVMLADSGRGPVVLGGVAGQRLEVAMEATRGWRFVVEERSAVGTKPRLAEPAGSSAVRDGQEDADDHEASARAGGRPQPRA